LWRLGAIQQEEEMGLEVEVEAHRAQASREPLAA